MWFYEELVVVMIKLSTLNLVRHWDGLVAHMHGYSHVRMVIYGGALRWVHTFIGSVSHVVDERVVH